MPTHPRPYPPRRTKSRPGPRGDSASARTFGDPATMQRLGAVREAILAADLENAETAARIQHILDQAAAEIREL